MKNIALIGSTGSIGKQTLEVVRRNPDKLKIVSLSAGENVSLFLEQVKEFKPKIATLKKKIDIDLSQYKETEFFFGEDAYKNAIGSFSDVALVSLVGYEGIIAVLDCIDKGVDIALANKESLVVGGEIVTKRAKEKGVNIYPVDSEHSAVWQAMGFDFNKPFNRIILTASGGAFRDFSKSQLEKVTAKEALKHPNWLMGAKITIDCATLVNKAFEVTEAKWLYNTTFDKIDVIIHRESIIHSMVEYIDGSTMAQMSTPTMELPIQLALLYPERVEFTLPRLDFSKLRTLSFEKVDNDRFPCFNLVVSASKKGGCYPAVANGANDCLVDLFLKGKIAYNDIYRGIDGALNAFSGDYNGQFADLDNANTFAKNFIKQKFGE